jgi:hypothetical protein
LRARAKPRIMDAAMGVFGWRRWQAAAAAAITSAAACVAACGGGGGSQAPDASNPQACVPGQSIACAGPAGCSGDQICAADGSGYGACQCEAGPGPDGGTGDAAQSDGSTDSGQSDAAVLAQLSFGVLGNTRPMTEDDTAGYPSAVVQKIFQDIQAAGPPLTVATGTYVFANPMGSQAAAQFPLYLAARGAFSGKFFPAMGDHECGTLMSNCDPSDAGGNNNFSEFLAKMLAPIGFKEPYYAVVFRANDDSWTAKFVFVAANAWTAAQGTWLDGELASATTYTFVVRNEGSTSCSGAPGVAPSEAIVGQHPFTIKLVGCLGEYAHLAAVRELVVGNGGAPLMGSGNYGYTLAKRRADGAIVFTAYDYMSNVVTDSFAVKADGAPAP